MRDSFTLLPLWRRWPLVARRCWLWLQLIGRYCMCGCARMGPKWSWDIAKVLEDRR